VAMFHLQAFSHIHYYAFLRHSFLFVDFFLVLSGFVTADFGSAILLDLSRFGPLMSDL
jgi:hypothetical protein